MERDSPRERRTTTRNRMGSPSAAKSVAGAATRVSGRFTAVPFEGGYLDLPTTLVLAQDARLAVGEKLIEARLGDRDASATFGVFQAECHKRHRFGRHILVGRSGVPAPGKGPFWDHLLDMDEEFLAVVRAGIYRAQLDVGAGSEGGFVGFSGEPTAELGNICDSAPDAGAGGEDESASLDLI